MMASRKKKGHKNKMKKRRILSWLIIHQKRHMNHTQYQHPMIIQLRPMMWPIKQRQRQRQKQQQAVIHPPMAVKVQITGKTTRFCVRVH